MFAHKLLVLLILTISLALDEESIKNFIDNIPQKDYVDFLKFALAAGYKKSTGVTVVDAMEIPGIFEELYEFYMTHASLEEIPEALGEKIVCFPSGCVDLLDPAVHP